jgi:hypothetical protein
MTPVEVAPKPTNSRIENETYQRWTEARALSGEEWPEPETSKFYQALRRAATLIISSVLHRQEPELARDTATKALLKVASFRNETLFSTWFYRIAVNEAKMEIRRQSRQREIQLDIVAEPEAPSTIATPKILSTEGLSGREKHLLDFLLNNTEGDSLKPAGDLDVYARQQKLDPSWVRKIWQSLRTKLKSHLTS